jgi:hypothetical protein
MPLVARLQRTVGNTNKLRSACVLWRAVGLIFQDCQVRVLVDCGYRRCKVIHYAQAGDVAVIGQGRRDTALYAWPVEEVTVTGRRRGGRPRR